ncbi:hypothetical protein A5638_28020 [Mycolicibacterium fortuitum]|nr:hypothetical protein A5638_28020 [Mycolicibacterium fortuitum]
MYEADTRSTLTRATSAAGRHDIGRGANSAVGNPQHRSAEPSSELPGIGTETEADPPQVVTVIARENTTLPNGEYE